MVFPDLQKSHSHSCFLFSVLSGFASSFDSISTQGILEKIIFYSAVTVLGQTHEIVIRFPLVCEGKWAIESGFLLLSEAVEEYILRCLAGLLVAFERVQGSCFDDVGKLCRAQPPPEEHHISIRFLHDYRTPRLDFVTAVSSLMI